LNKILKKNLLFFFQKKEKRILELFSQFSVLEKQRVFSIFLIHTPLPHTDGAKRFPFPFPVGRRKGNAAV
jgi:hypothetical protein